MSEDAQASYFVGNKFTPNHKQSCSPRGVTCRNCKKKGHIAKCYNSKVVANIDAEPDEMIKSEFAVLNIDRILNPEFLILASIVSE